jgi:hypothetical protein
MDPQKWLDTFVEVPVRGSLCLLIIQMQDCRNSCSTGMLAR